MLPSNQNLLTKKLDDLVNHRGHEIVQIIPYPHKTTVMESKDKYFNKNWKRYEEIPVDIVSRYKVEGKYKFHPPKEPLKIKNQKNPEWELRTLEEPTERW